MERSSKMFTVCLFSCDKGSVVLLGLARYLLSPSGNYFSYCIRKLSRITVDNYAIVILGFSFPKYSRN